MSDFVHFAMEIGSDSLYQVIGMIVILVFTLFFLGHRLFKFAFLFFVVFLIIFVAWLRGPMGKEMIEKFQGKRPPLFQLPTEADKEKIREQRELLKRNKEKI
jgi:hypothetical protein